MKSILQVLNGETLHVPPLWLMRQAGRYLPEYRALREQAKSFLDLVYDAEQAAEVTLQPIRRFGFDAAILFADILVVPQGMGVDVTFTEGEGPKLSPVANGTDLDRLFLEDNKFYQSVYDTVGRSFEKLQSENFPDTTLIGFAGGPWTLACYMVQGSAKDHDFEIVRARAFADPDFFDTLIDKITTATIIYLRGQAKAGVEAVQIFDSWAGVAGDVLFDRYVVAPTKRIVTELRREFPTLPIIGFPRGAGDRLSGYAVATDVTAVGADYTTDLEALRRDLGARLPIQGNLDPTTLLAGGSQLTNSIERIRAQLTNTPHIFNLGHGILPETPIAHVEQLIKAVRGV